MTIEYDVQPGDISQSWRDIVDIVGVEAMLELSRAMGGCDIYIPKYSNLIRPARNRQIRAEFTGSNTKQLAVKYNLTTVSIREILKEK